MKRLIILAAILGAVFGNCGCLKCSKHLTLAGAVPGAPGQAPVKVIYRDESGYPWGPTSSFAGSANPVTVQVPAPLPSLPSLDCGKEISVAIEPFYRPISSDFGRQALSGYRGTSFIDDPSTSIGFSSIPRLPGLSGIVRLPGDLYSDGGFAESEGALAGSVPGDIVPVKVEIPVPSIPPIACQLLPELSTTLDRVIVPRPAINPTQTSGVYEKTIHTCCGPLKCPFVPAAHPRACCYNDRYDYKKDISNHENNANQQHTNLKRSKRELPILKNSYRFVMNMLPQFIQEPIKKTVNSMALTHPDPKLQKIYNLPLPQLSLQERIVQKHKDNIAAIKNKILGPPPIVKQNHHDNDRYYSQKRRGNQDYPNNYDKYGRSKKNRESNKYVNEMSQSTQYRNDRPYSKRNFDSSLIDYEADNFIETLQAPQYRNRQYAYSKEAEEYRDPRIVRARSPLVRKESHQHSNHWTREMNSDEILGEYFTNNHDDFMSEKEKARFLLKLKKLNKTHVRSKRNINDVEAKNNSHKKTANKVNDQSILIDKLKGTDLKGKMKRSIIIDSEELALPLYQIKIRDSIKDNIIDSDYDYDYDYDYDDSSQDDAIVGSKKKVEVDLREESIRRAIREELQNFKDIDSSEAIDDFVPSPKRNWITKYPLLNILTFPMKVLKSLNNEEEFPIVKAVPRMLVDTKRYFKDFGKNLKKNVLHFTSDMIGDFDYYGSPDSILDKMGKRKRFKRNIVNHNQTHHSNNDSEIKVRKKRYILKMVDDDEIEELLREKLGKIIGDKDNTPKPQRRRKVKSNRLEESEEQRKIVERLFGKTNKQKINDDDHITATNNKRRRKSPRVRSKKVKAEDSMEDLRKKIVIEPIKPKLIIDNNGLPFMEINGYKRPIFMKKDKNKADDVASEENESFDPYDSSEEVNMQKINFVISRAKSRKELPNRNPDIPLHALKEKISQLLYDIDVLVHMNCEKFDQIYDDLIQVQAIKTSVVQSWKRLIMDKKINDYEAKIGLLEKFTQLQHVKNSATKNIVYTLYEERENGFAVKKLIGVLATLQKVQCLINQVVDCFQEKFKTGSKFDVSTEIKFVDFLSSLRFVEARTRNEMIQLLMDERDLALQENIHLLEKLKILLVEDDDQIIAEEANLLWEMKHVRNMQISTIEEMLEKMENDMRIKKCLKILFDLYKRLKTLEEKEKTLCSTKSNEISSESEEDDESCEEEDDSKESKKKLRKFKKFYAEEVKKKWQDKIEKQKTRFEECFKEQIKKMKTLRDKSKESDEDEGEDR